jgi:hypothetical protein
MCRRSQVNCLCENPQLMDDLLKSLPCKKNSGPHHKVYVRLWS